MSPATSLAQRRVKKAISGLAHLILIEEAAGQEPSERTLQAITDQLFGKLDAMPAHLRAGMMTMTVVFDLYGLPRSGHRCHHLDPTQRRALLDQWKNGRLSVLRDFVAFYEKMGIFVYYSLLEEDHPTPEAHR